MNYSSRLIEPQAHWHEVLARVHEGATAEEIRSDARAFSDALMRELPMDSGTVALEVQPLVEAKIDPAIRSAVLILFGAVGVVMLIACVNLAGLLLIRATGHRQEIAIRLALGASRGRIVQQLLVESIMLSLIGGVLGLVIAFWAIDILVSFRPEGTEGIWQNYSTLIRPETVSLNDVAALFHFSTAILAGIFFGIVPAVQSSRRDLNDALNTTKPGATERFVHILRLNKERPP